MPPRCEGPAAASDGRAPPGLGVRKVQGGGGRHGFYTAALFPTADLLAKHPNASTPMSTPGQSHWVHPQAVSFSGSATPLKSSAASKTCVDRAVMARSLQASWRCCAATGTSSSLYPVHPGRRRRTQLAAQPTFHGAAVHHHLHLSATQRGARCSKTKVARLCVSSEAWLKCSATAARQASVLSAERKKQARSSSARPPCARSVSSASCRSSS